MQRKIFIHLVGSEAFEDAKDLAVVRVERLYPFPAEELQPVIERYSKIESFAWVQEEPRNMGARKFVLPRIRHLVPYQIPLGDISRPERSRPAEEATRRLTRWSSRESSVRPSPDVDELLERYRSLIARKGEAFPITLGEGGTPLIHARRLGAEIGLDQLHLKFEGTNPTGLFKDRGMVLAVNRAVAAGAGAVVLASTGNTSASAAAYAAAAGLPCHVILPAGKFARGKLAQALAAGARLTMVDGNFDAALSAVRRLGEEGLAVVVNSINPDRRRASRRRPGRLSTTSDARPMRWRCRSETPATSPPTGADSAGTRTRDGDEPAANARLPGRGRGADRAR